MHDNAPPSHDVLVAGAGPVGLFLACELALASCSVLVLEQAPEPGGPLKRPPFGLRGLFQPTLDSLDRRGLLDGLLDRIRAAEPVATHWMRPGRRPVGHFGGVPIFLDRADTRARPHRSAEAGGPLLASMADIEAVLLERAVALGVEIRWGCAVEAIATTQVAIDVLAGGRAHRGSWLVGCDGARSAVRTLASIVFRGTEPEFTGYSVQARPADPGALTPGRHRTAAGIYSFAVPDTISLMDWDGGAGHRAEPPTREHLEAVLHRITGRDVRLAHLERATSWTDRAFQAETYRLGRVLLAGDAAHIHAPVGGQGLNLGIGDAMNLGWKLAAQIRNRAPAGLLDSYQAERHPVGASVLDWSRAQVALMRPDRGAQALEAIIRDLLDTRDGATLVTERAWGVGLRYQLGNGHAWLGRSVADIAPADGVRLNRLLRDGAGLLANSSGTAPHALAAWGERIRFVAATGDRPDGCAVLVRPDGIVCWVGDPVTDGKGLADAAMRWFGKPG